MGKEFAAMCSKLPCKNGENKIPFIPSADNGISAPQQFWNQPKFCRRNPNHIKMSITKGMRSADTEKIFFQFIVGVCQTKSQIQSTEIMAIKYGWNNYFEPNCSIFVLKK